MPEFPRTRSFVPRNVYLARSSDGGRTFTTGLVYEAPREDPHHGYNYAPVGAVDPSNPKRVYVGWAQGEWQSPKEPVKAVVAASSDSGKTFAEPVDISELQGAEHPWITVGRDGAVHGVYWSKGFGKPLPDPPPFVPTARRDPVPIYHMRSTDQGRTWSRAEIDPGVQAYYRPPVIAADPNSDAVYVAWYSTTERNNYELTRRGADRTDIFLRASDDGGRTWRERTTVNDDAGRGANHSLPGLSIAPDGRVDVAWNDGRHNPKPAVSPGRDTGLLDVYYASSNDGGRTFGPNVRVNDRSIDRSLGVWSNNVNAAVAVGLASTDDAAYFAWQDTRAGKAQDQAEDVYFASAKLDGITVAGQGISGTGRALAQMGAGAVLGMGLAMVVGWTLSRRTPRAPA